MSTLPLASFFSIAALGVLVAAQHAVDPFRARVLRTTCLLLALGGWLGIAIWIIGNDTTDPNRNPYGAGAMFMVTGGMFLFASVVEREAWQARYYRIVGGVLGLVGGLIVAAWAVL